MDLLQAFVWCKSCRERNNKRDEECCACGELLHSQPVDVELERGSFLFGFSPVPSVDSTKTPQWQFSTFLDTEVTRIDDAGG